MASLSVMTLTTMFLYQLNAKAQGNSRFSEGDQAGTIFSILFWLIAFLFHHAVQREELIPQLLTIEFVAMNLGVGFQMFFAIGSGSMIGWILNSFWLVYAAMGIVAFYSEDSASPGTAATPPTEPKVIMLDLKEVEEKLERVQARLDRVKAAAKKTE